MARLMGPAEVHQGGMVDGVQLDPVSFLVYGLSARFAPLDEEHRLQAVTRLLPFSRRPHETIDNLITRFEVTRQRAVVDGGGAAVSAETAALMILRACGVSSLQFQQLTAPLQHRLPTTEVELATLTHHLRRMGHFLERRPGGIANALGGVGSGSRQDFFGGTPDAGTDGTDGTDPTQWWGGSYGAATGFAPTTADPPASQDSFRSQGWDAGYEVSDPETIDGSSAPVDFSDVQHLTENDQDAEIYWQYHEPKRR